jgi:hypothetical protein
VVYIICSCVVKYLIAYFRPHAATRLLLLSFTQVSPYFVAYIRNYTSALYGVAHRAQFEMLVELVRTWDRLDETDDNKDRTAFD